MEFGRDRVLVVEDDGLIALMIEDMLADLGCAVVGPAARVADAMALVSGSAAFDVALLDVNVGGEPVFPLADVLRARGVPLILTTGYGEAALRPVDRACPILRKPFVEAELAAALAVALGRSSNPRPTGRPPQPAGGAVNVSDRA